MKAEIRRGLKWNNILEGAKFRNDSKAIDWVLKQKAILKDIEAYKNSLPKEIKPKEKK